MIIRRYITIILSVLLSCTLIGCASNAPADLSYSNHLYSYETDDTVSIGVWCPYDDAYLKKLKENYALEERVADCKTEFEKVQTITRWVTNLWSHNGDNVPQESGPLFILDSVINDGEQYRCVEYGTVISGCLNALGIPTRTIGLKTHDVETREYGAGHVAAEAYLKDYKKWVFIDGQWGIIPLMGEMPLNAVQLGQVLDHPEEYEEALDLLTFQGSGSSGREYMDWIREYLYYFDVTTYMRSDHEVQECRIMLTPSESINPVIFQIHYPLEIDIYTHSVPAFYPNF